PVAQDENLPVTADHIWQVAPMPGEELFEYNEEFRTYRVEKHIPEERFRPLAETIARIFHENPKLAWEFLDVQQPSAKRIAEIRKSELLEAADTDPRPLRHYVIIGAKKLMRRLNRLIDKSMTNTRAPL